MKIAKREKHIDSLLIPIALTEKSKEQEQSILKFGMQKTYTIQGEERTLIQKPKADLISASEKTTSKLATLVSLIMSRSVY